MEYTYIHNHQSQFLELFGNPVTNPMGWPTERIDIVAPESPSKEDLPDSTWVLNLDMIESNTGQIISKQRLNADKTLSVLPFDEGNVLFSKLRPYLNKVVLPDEKGLATTELVPLRPNPAKLSKVFFTYLLRSDQFVQFANDIAGGTKMPRMPLSELRKFQCILPPIESQLQFESIVDQADKSKFDGFKSQFLEMTRTADRHPIGQLCDIFGGATPARTNKEYWENGTCPWFTVEDLHNQGAHIWKTEQHITEAALKKVKKYPVDTVLLCCTSATIGSVAYSHIPLSSNQQFNGLVVKDRNKLRPEFLFYNCTLLKDELLKQCGKTTFAFVPRGTLEKIEIFCPDIHVQNQFVKVLEQADKSKYYEINETIYGIL